VAGKKPDDKLAAFRARFQPAPTVRVRHGAPPRPRAPAPPAAPAAPREDPRAGVARWEALPDHPSREVPFDPPARGRILAGTGDPGGRLTACSDCGRPFDPDAPEHRRHGRLDQCGPCGRGEDPPRLQGEMEWYHKSVPVLRILGRPDPTTPEEKAKLRRR
jgi:hypothetical protein